MSRAVGALLADGRLHLQHGPIDLICEAWGTPVALQAGYRQAAWRFSTVLEELVAELPVLRSETGVVRGQIARRMARAVAPFAPVFITPMAAVAGAVAETVLAALVAPGVTRAYVNNGGDIALHLAPGESLTCGLADVGGPRAPGSQIGRVRIAADTPVRGIATSGWRGRSWSFGIADAVTVLARSAAMADAAATMIANAVDLPGHPAITRRPADQLQADTDLGGRLVTTAVPALCRTDARTAVASGIVVAEAFRARGLIEAAAIFLQSEHQITGTLPVAHRESEPV